MNESTTLTNRERRENVAFLGQAFLAAQKLPAEILDAEQRDRFTSDESEQNGLFYTLLCYGALAAQPAPESVVDADWRRLGDAGVVDALFAGEFDLTRYALDPPVSRNDSKGKVIDFIRLSETRDIWGRLLPQPPDPDVAVDVLHAASGGALKSRAFWAVREMRRYGCGTTRRWTASPASRTAGCASAPCAWACVDLPEKADTFADMKAVLPRPARGAAPGESPDGCFDLPISMADQRCEVCDAARMAACPMPHCRWRREHARRRAADAAAAIGPPAPPPHLPSPLGLIPSRTVRQSRRTLTGTVGMRIADCGRAPGAPPGSLRHAGAPVRK